DFPGRQDPRELPRHGRRLGRVEVEVRAGRDPVFPGGVHEPCRSGEAGRCGDGADPGRESARAVRQDIQGPLRLRTFELLRSPRGAAAALPSPKPPGADPPGPAHGLRAALQGPRRRLERRQPAGGSVADRGGPATRGLRRPEVLRADVLDFGREVAGDLAVAESREWLCTNGIGGFASGTAAGSLARRYHGLLMAALTPPLGRTLMAAKLDESLTYGGSNWQLGANRWASGAVAPDGHRFIERFRVEGGVPGW